MRRHKILRICFSTKTRYVCIFSQCNLFIFVQYTLCHLFFGYTRSHPTAVDWWQKLIHCRVMSLQTDLYSTFFRLRTFISSKRGAKKILSLVRKLICCYCSVESEAFKQVAHTYFFLTANTLNFMRCYFHWDLQSRENPHQNHRLINVRLCPIFVWCWLPYVWWREKKEWTEYAQSFWNGNEISSNIDLRAKRIVCLFWRHLNSS